MTDLLQWNVVSATFADTGAADDLGVARALDPVGLGPVQSGGVVVGLPEPHRERKHRALVLALSRAAAASDGEPARRLGRRARAAGRQRGERARPRADAAALRGLRVRLRVPLVSAARRRA